MASKSKKNKTVFAAMSGGVDSSVAAYLLKKQGYRVVGCFIKGYNLDGCAERDSEDARLVAEKLEIPFYVFDLEKEYKSQVVEYLIDGYRKGLTPNPDVVCNKAIKFGIFLRKAVALGANFVATGHYVRLKTQTVNGRRVYNLFRAKDLNKDQSYFLWQLNQPVLRRALFPVGDLLKPAVRKIAARAGLPTAKKKDSQGICFLGKISLADFLRQHIAAEPGAVVTADGRVLGEHWGVQFYTVGQRHLNLIRRFNLDKKPAQPIYVAAKDVKKNQLIVGEGRDDEILFHRTALLAEVNFISGRQLPAGQRVWARVRYRQPLAPARILKIGASWALRFDRKQKFIAPGQSAVFYTGRGKMLGGGEIKATQD